MLVMAIEKQSKNYFAQHFHSADMPPCSAKLGRSTVFGINFFHQNGLAQSEFGIKTLVHTWDQTGSYLCVATVLIQNYVLKQN